MEKFAISSLIVAIKKLRILIKLGQSFSLKFPQRKFLIEIFCSRNFIKEIFNLRTFQEKNFLFLCFHGNEMTNNFAQFQLN